jgi:hypothetical protein
VDRKEMDHYERNLRAEWLKLEVKMKYKEEKEHKTQEVEEGKHQCS